MPRLVEEITIAREPAVVFALLTDFGEVAKILPGIKESVVLTPGPVRVGARVRETRDVKGRDRMAEYVVVVHDPPRRFWMEVEERGKKVGEGGFDLTPYSGATRLVYTLSFQLPWFLAVLSPLVKRTVEREMKGDLAAMKAHLEQG